MSTTASRSVTSFDVARELGISRATVSAVLAGSADRLRISAETTQRVLETAARLNYFPNQAARSLRQRRSRMIGVVMINFRQGWADSVMEGMYGVLSDTKYTVFVAAHQMVAERARKELLSCLMRRDEGVICQPIPNATELFRRIQKSRTPLILLGDYPESMPDVNFVGWDSSAAARVALNHLMDLGRRRIAYVGIAYPMKMAQSRFSTYQAVVRDAGLPSVENWSLVAPLDWPAARIARWAVDQMFVSGQEHPDAIYAQNDDIALAILGELHERGIRLPDDVALIGMGNLPMTGHSCVGLSSMREPTEEMGREAAKLMLELLDGSVKGPVHRLVNCAELKVRRTTRLGECRREIAC